jgi:opacity protein-like surface antigen
MREMPCRRFLESVSVMVLTMAMSTPIIAAEPQPTGKSVFDWSRSYASGTIGYAAAGQTATTEVNDKFGVLASKPQHGLMLSAEYGRLIDAHYDWRVALRGAGVPEHIVDAVGTWGLSYGNTSLAYQTLDGEVGRRIQLSDPLALRAFAGLRAIHANDSVREEVLGMSTISQMASTQTWGIGPRGGVEFSLRMGSQPVFLTGGVDASVLFGNTTQTATYRADAIVGSLGSSWASTIYTLGGRVGVTWFASPGTSLTIGYQAEQLWNIRQAHSDIAFDDLGTLNGRGHNLVHGPFARVAVHFDPARPAASFAMNAPNAPAVEGWSGLKAGADAGAALGVARARNATYYLFDTDETFGYAGGGNVSGALLGLHLGYDMQFGSLVAGVEVDWSWTSMAGVGKIYDVRTVGFDFDSLATLRARAGWAHEKALFYVTGGAAWASPVGKLMFAGAPAATERQAYQGWVAGLGFEYRIAPRWSVRAEYLHYDLGSRPFRLAAPNGDIYSADMSMTADALRVGLTYTLPVLR